VKMAKQTEVRIAKRKIGESIGPIGDLIIRRKRYNIIVFPTQGWIKGRFRDVWVWKVADKRQGGTIAGGVESFSTRLKAKRRALSWEKSLGGW